MGRPVARQDPGLGRRSAGWHYVNIAEDNCHYEAPKHCRNGNCIVEALKAQSAILGDRSLTDGERLQALKFVVHLVGDIHQPMHAGYAHDKGGNDFQLQFGNRGTNLHSLWDSGMLNTRKLDDAGYLPLLQSQRAPKLARQSNPQRDRRRGPRPAAAFPCKLAFIRPRVKSVTNTPSATGRWPKRSCGWPVKTWRSC